jgi:hypothetical protein
MSEKYNTNLQAGQGLLEETRLLFTMWKEGMDKEALFDKALQSGHFPTISARRLKNIVYLAFAPRVLDTPEVIPWLMRLEQAVPRPTFDQLLYIYTARANRVFADFVREVYWPAYAAGRQTLSNEDARAFVDRANAEGLTQQPWAASTERRVASYLTGTAADFSLLEGGRKVKREIRPIRIRATTSVYLAYDLHFHGVGDNALLTHQDWALFGLERADVLEELRRMALQKWVIVQSAANVTTIDWLYDSMEDVIDGIVEREV